MIPPFAIILQVKEVSLNSFQIEAAIINVTIAIPFGRKTKSAIHEFIKGALPPYMDSLIWLYLSRRRKLAASVKIPIDWISNRIQLSTIIRLLWGGLKCGESFMDAEAILQKLHSRVAAEYAL